MPDPAADGRSPAREAAWLVLRTQSGDRAALESLLEHALAELRPYAAAMIADEDVRGDVLQEVLVLVYRKLPSLREPRAFNAWARRVASREIFRALRRLRRHERATEELSPDLPDGHEEPAAPDGLIERLPALLEGVSPASRAVLALHYLDGLTLDEIAGVLEIPSGTVKSRLAYGLAALRRALVP